MTELRWVGWGQLVGISQHNSLDMKSGTDENIKEVFHMSGGGLDLTGTWSCNDGGIYYVRQNGVNIWWAGLSGDRGLTFTNIFRGTIQVGSATIAGDWADVPRGTILGNGTLALSIVTTPTGLLTFQKQSETGTGFGGSFWEKVTIAVPPDDIRYKFDHVRRNDGGTMHDHLKMYKDNVVVFGTVTDPLGVGYPANTGRSYADFMCGVDDGQFDGDITFHMRIERANLDAQPSFWTQGWFNDPNHIRAKLDDSNNSMHPELIMYGRTAGKDNCVGNAPTLLPGWIETAANSILLNGRPINGQVDFGPPVRILDQEIPVGTRIRITGFLALDCHGAFGDCHEDDPHEHNEEIHPTYSIDVIQNFHLPRPSATLTGVWAATDVGTYYMRQVGDTVWWLGLSRDQGQTFANVFQGTITGRNDQGQLGIVGLWTDVPLGVFLNSGAVSLISPPSVSTDSPSVLNATNTGIFQGYTWEKLYE